MYRLGVGSNTQMMFGTTVYSWTASGVYQDLIGFESNNGWAFQVGMSPSAITITNQSTSALVYDKIEVLAIKNNIQ